MKLETCAVAALALLVALSPAGFAQQLQPNQPGSSDLVANAAPAVAWSEMQTPQPVPSANAVPTPNQQEQQPPDSPSATPTQASGTQAQAQPGTQTFTGTVVKKGEKYVLKTDNMTYQLDDQDKAKEYEGKQVKVTGSLDVTAKLIQIQNVEEAAPGAH
jgi:hypothetical protein